MTTANMIDVSKIDPEVLSEVRLHDGGTLLPGAAEVVAQIISADARVKTSGPADLAALVAESFERFRERYADPDAPPPASRSRLRGYLKGLEERGLLAEGGADGAYAALATATASQPLGEQIKAARKYLASRSANRHLPIAERHGPPPAEAKLRSLLRTHFPELSEERRERLAAQHTDIAAHWGGSEAEAIKVMAFRLGLGPDDARHNAVGRTDGSGVSYGAGGKSVAAAWPDRVTPELSAAVRSVL